jgi:hypothetical protein
VLVQHEMERVACPPHIDPGCVNTFQESARTANPVQTSAIFGAWKGFFVGVVDAGFPLQYDDFPHGRALSSAG